MQESVHYFTFSYIFFSKSPSAPKMYLRYLPFSVSRCGSPNCLHDLRQVTKGRVICSGASGPQTLFPLSDSNLASSCQDDKLCVQLIVRADGRVLVIKIQICFPNKKRIVDLSMKHRFLIKGILDIPVLVN